MSPPLPSDLSTDTPSVTIWTWQLDQPETLVSSYKSLLSEGERATADRFVSPIHRSRYVVAHGVLREILGSATDRTPASLRFRTERNGKPSLVADGARQPFFNLAHSDHLAALALCWEQPIGVDIEAAKPFPEGVAEAFFSPAERCELALLRGREARDRFYALWTCKEAILKATGAGLSIPLDSFDIAFAGEKARVTRFVGRADPDQHWTLVRFVPAPGFAGCLALPAAACHFDLRSWPA